jgi:2-polyprenyl-6-methoxyphenol hydroxylase-like FAD-dependent oxidoreductase
MSVNIKRLGFNVIFSFSRFPLPNGQSTQIAHIMDKSSFKVIIAGGSIAGLSLALMLERNDIDYVILEGYHSIAPQVGASIGILPNGARILDQLGCWESVRDAAEYPVDTFHCRDSTGKIFWTFDNFDGTSIDRFVASSS